MNNLLYIIYLVVLVWSIYDIWTSKMDEGKKILWTVVCLLFTVLGTIIYVLVGRKK